MFVRLSYLLKHEFSQNNGWRWVLLSVSNVLSIDNKDIRSRKQIYFLKITKNVVRAWKKKQESLHIKMILLILQSKK